MQWVMIVNRNLEVKSLSDVSIGFPFDVKHRRSIIKYAVHISSVTMGNLQIIHRADNSLMILSVLRIIS